MCYISGGQIIQGLGLYGEGENRRPLTRREKQIIVELMGEIPVFFLTQKSHRRLFETPIPIEVYDPERRPRVLRGTLEGHYQ